MKGQGVFDPDVRPHLASNILYLIVMPTEACNFRCAYCFERFARGRMRPDVVSALLRFLTRRAPGLDRLTVAHFGGEPLLAVDIVERVQEHVLSLTRTHPKLRFAGTMTTNGFLLHRERLRRLVTLGVRQFQISVDGPRELHDRMRVLADGRGTFDRIWSNLLDARYLREEFEVIVRVHVARDNLDALPGFLDDYREAFGSDRRFSLFLRPLSRLGASNDERLAVLEDDAADRTVEHLRIEARRSGLRQMSYGEDETVCHAATANSFVVRSDGTLVKCAVVLEHPDNRVGRLLSDGRVELDAARMKDWMRGLFSSDPGERSCPMRNRVPASP